MASVMSDRIGFADALAGPFPLPQSQPVSRIGNPITQTPLARRPRMTARMFRLTQIHQRIDERLRLEMRKRQPDRGELSRLSRLKLRAKSALIRLAGRSPALA
jgi:hypothetical protein